MKKVKPKRWKPEKDKIYYFIGTVGSILTMPWAEDSIDRSRLKFGNVFATEREAQAALRRVKLALRGE